MGDSNGAWGELVDDEFSDVFDQYERLPEPGENPALDAFVDRKHIDIDALVRVGARIQDNVLVFAFPSGIKFRDMVTDRRWSYIGSEWRHLKIVRAGREPSRIVLVAEGETDAARLTMLYEADVAVLPAGADPRPHAAEYAAQLNDYELVLLAHDPDRAGDDGAALLQEHLTTKTARWLAPNGDDWSSLTNDAGVPPLPDPNEIEIPVSQRILVRARDLLELETPEIASYLEQAMLPVGGSMIIHGAMKSFKSYSSFDLASALAQGTSWAGFEVVDEPQLVAIMQFEIPWAYYKQRVEHLRAAARAPELFDENFMTWTPQNRPRFRAGNTQQEDQVLKELTDAGVTVFVLDPIRRATGAVDINLEKDVRPMLDFFDRLNREGITVITTHHDNKSGTRSRGGDPNEMTGSGAFGGDPDTIVSIALPKGHDITSTQRNMHFLLRNAPSPGARSMTMDDSGSLTYGLYPIGDDADEPSPDSDSPAI